MAKFGPGNNANPSGRPKVAQEFKARCQKAVTETVLAKWIAEVESGGEHWVKCSELLANYGMGKPSQSVEVVAPPVESEQLEQLSDGDLRALIAATSDAATTH
jgi:hypothetical protein